MHLLYWPVPVSTVNVVIGIDLPLAEAGAWYDLPRGDSLFFLRGNRSQAGLA
ncbi:MAG: hypothetical protein K8T89_18395 [Planctomycetes bacterium]|nr:hypothetical protein [Planctomycetota bacterium]